jgi:hypothetical protein
MMRRQSSGPPSPWGTVETKKRIVDALKSENSEIHSYTGDIAVTGCAKVNNLIQRKIKNAPNNSIKRIQVIRLLGTKDVLPGNDMVIHTPDINERYVYKI